jgi:hypothetical protein
MSNLKLIQLNNYVKPIIKENKSKGYVTNGVHNSYFKYVNDRYIGSPTNSAIINGYISWIYGKGLACKDQVQKPSQYARLYSILKKKDIKRVVADYETQGMAYIQIIRNRDKSISSIEHIAVDKIAPEIANEDNVIEAYYYSHDFKDNKIEPTRIKAFGVGNSYDAIEIYCIRPYQLGMNYFALPSYQSCLQYAELEEEISNYSINHMRNGLSTGYIINIPDSYNLDDEAKSEIEKNIKRKLTGSSRAGTFMINFANGENSEITVTNLEINDAHKQWESLNEISQSKILTAHEVVSPMLFGVKDASGFSSNADELAESERQTIERVVQPKQDSITDAFEEILQTDDITLDLYFKPLSERTEVVEKTELKKQGKNEPDKEVADALISLGQNIDLNAYELIDDIVADNFDLKETQLNNLVELAKAPRANNVAKSEQDTSLFLIRYAYAGNPKGEREFCNKVIQANKFYRYEDLENASKNSNVNPGFGPKGTDTYNIALYKGGVNCKHFWERKIFLKKDRSNLSVNNARKMILALDPADRKEAMWQTNDKKVAQVAEAQNNFWKLK